jgi:histidyl-tRNA synthetase
VSPGTKGVPDYVPPRSEHLLAVREAMAAPLRLAGYGYLELPVFEDTALFARGVGETTDVVSKEMFTFVDRGERSLTLRPEGRSAPVRAALDAGLERGALPVKLWYAGPMFRYEQPQSGRQRQFTQVGAEALGSDDPRSTPSSSPGRPGLPLARAHADGAPPRHARRPEDRADYSARLRDWLRPRVGGLDAETDRRIELNPLRCSTTSGPRCARPPPTRRC